jgi:type I restriction enzyme S subunit
MKDSGVEWIGKIPSEWEIKKAKYCVSIDHGSDPETQGEIPVYGSGSRSFKTCGEYKEGPTVLIGRKGATLHIPHYIEGKYWNVDTAFDVHTKSGFNLRFYYYCSCCFDYKFYISQTTLPGMTQRNYENMSIPVPSFSEQQAIADYLDKKCASIDESIERSRALIEELGEYKKSLIYEVVTGKREV